MSNKDTEELEEGGSTSDREIRSNTKKEGAFAMNLEAVSQVAVFEE